MLYCARDEYSKDVKPGTVIKDKNGKLVADGERGATATWGIFQVTAEAKRKEIIGST